MRPLINPARLHPGLLVGGGITIAESGVTPLVDGQSYIDVVFEEAQANAYWHLLECEVVNTVDATPLNISAGIITVKTTTGFRLQLGGMPDSDNYFLHWAITAGTPPPPPPATGYSLSGPSTGDVGVASTNFTVTLTPSGGAVTGTVTVTPSDGGGGGTFTPSSSGLTTSVPSATFTYTPASGGAKTISATNSGGLTNPTSLTYTVTAPLGDGDPISNWEDSSVNANHATSSGSNRPTFKQSVLHLNPVVHFTSAGASKLDLTTPISTLPPWTVFSVMKPTAIASTMQSLSCGAASGPSALIENTSAEVIVSDRAGYDTISNPTIQSFAVFTTRAITATPIALWINGTSQSLSHNPNVSSANFDAIGWRNTPVYSDGDVAEVIYYNATLSSTDRANIEKYLGDKYDIPVAGGTAVDPSTVSGLQGWWKADSIGPAPDFAVADTFTDTNATSLPSHTMDIGSGWTRYEGLSTNQMTIQSNRASGFNDVSSAYAYYTESSLADCTVGVTAIFGVSGNYCQIVFRYVNATNWWTLRVNGGVASPTMVLVKCVSGTETVVASTSVSLPLALPIILRVVLNGTSISATAGPGSLSTTDAFNQTATKHGIRTYCSGGTLQTLNDFYVF